MGSAIPFVIRFHVNLTTRTAKRVTPMSRMLGLSTLYKTILQIGTLLQEFDDRSQLAIYD